jgi:hypothetical protein
MAQCIFAFLSDTYFVNSRLHQILAPSFQFLTQTKMKKYIYVLAAMFCSLSGFSQRSGLQSLALEDMSAFKTQAGNWMVVGDVSINPNIDIHEPSKKEEPAVATGKKRKKGADPAPVEKPKAVTYTAGKGILLNMNDESRKDNLVTNFEHGDIELELEVMLPKGSNSGIYLQGRYEIQLLDSWGVKNPKYGDIGGIYRNWENTPGKIYMGKAPLSNPAKAPGLWQKMRIAFRAPRFDTSGKKIANASFAYVELNGVRIHDNVEVPLPTGGPLENNEKATAPLMIQGDHGPVAFRNIKYRLMKETDISLSNISYKTYYGNFKSVSDYSGLKPASTGMQPALSCEILDIENAYGSTYTGMINIPEAGDYEFILRYTGGATFSIDNQELINYQSPDGWRNDRKKVSLQAGSHPFEIQNFKDAGWMPPRLGLHVQSENTYPKALHAFSSFPPDDNPDAPILVSAGDGPKLLRAFIDFKGDRSKRLTHTIGVGEPSKINYVYDLRAGNLVCAWRGEFVDATPMWNDRGDGSFRPRGAAQYLFMNQPLALLADERAAFPLSGDENEFRGKGYQIDEATGRPVFKYTYKGLEVEDKIVPEDENRILTREVAIKSGTQQGLYFKLAEGNSIQVMPDGSYAVDDKQYYVKVIAPSNAIIRDSNGKKELVVPVSGSSIRYSLVW